MEEQNMHEGVHINPDVLQATQASIISQLSIRNAQLEAAVQTVMMERDELARQLQAEQEKLQDSEAAGE